MEEFWLKKANEQWRQGFYRFPLPTRDLNNRELRTLERTSLEVRRIFWHIGLTKPTSWSIVLCMEVTRTQEKILHAAKTLMLSKGYPATTVDEICESAQVSKGSFYHAFSSKRGIGLSLLEWYHQGGAEKIFGGSFNDVKDAKQKMFEFLDHVDRSSKELWHNGCLLGNLGMELAETSPKIRIEVSRNFKKLTHRLEEIFEPAAKGKPQEVVPPQRSWQSSFWSCWKDPSCLRGWIRTGVLWSGGFRILKPIFNHWLDSFYLSLN